MQTYKIHTIVNSAPAQFGKTRVVFKTNETGEKMISCFTKFPDSIKVGADIQGEIKEVQKDDKTYYNFDFGSASTPTKAAPSSDFETKVLNDLTGIKLTLAEIAKTTKLTYEHQIEPQF